MMLPRCCLALLLAGCAVPAYGQVPLEWKLKEGDRFYVETVTHLKQQLKAMGQPFNQDLEHTSVLGFTVKKHADTGTVLEEKIEAMKFKADPAAVAVPEEKFVEKLQGLTLLITLNARGEVTNLEGHKELIKKLTADDPNTRKLVESLLTEEALKQTAGDIFAGLPEKPVSKNDKWTRKVEQRLGPLGTLSVTRSYTYEGKDTLDGKPVEKITYTAATTFAPAKGKGDLPFEVTKADVKTEDYRGTLLFDPTLGRLVQSDARLRIRGTLTLKFMDKEIEAELAQDQATKSRVLDKPPK